METTFRWNNTPDTGYAYVGLEVTKTGGRQVRARDSRVVFLRSQSEGKPVGFDCFCGVLDKRVFFFKVGSARPRVSGFRVTTGFTASSLLYLSPRLTPCCRGVTHSQVSTVEKRYE